MMGKTDLEANRVIGSRTTLIKVAFSSPSSVMFSQWWCFRKRYFEFGLAARCWSKWSFTILIPLAPSSCPASQLSEMHSRWWSRIKLFFSESTLLKDFHTPVYDLRKYPFGKFKNHSLKYVSSLLIRTLASCCGKQIVERRVDCLFPCWKRKALLLRITWNSRIF